jgi:translation initiation factor 3 subunit K
VALVHQGANLRRYQFNADLYNVDVVVNILLKALTATPSPDFNLCMALLSERTNVPPGDDADAEHDPATLLPILSSLSRSLNECRFPAFWMLYRDDSLTYLRENFTVEVVGFEDGIREVVVKAVKSTFTKIGVARLGSYLDLSGKIFPQRMPDIHLHIICLDRGGAGGVHCRRRVDFGF